VAVFTRPALRVLERPVRVLTQAPPMPGFWCTGCGYGASGRAAPERCPMCGGTVWLSRGPTSVDELGPPA
jgi:rubrerythrin